MVRRIISRYLKKHATYKTLYHGTLKDHKASIERHGLWGSVGDFVLWGYGYYGSSVNDFQEIVYAADKVGIDRALTAITHHVGKKLGKDLQDVTNEEIKQHGMLVKILDGEESFCHRREDDDNNYNDEHPVTVEPGDYYTDCAAVDAFLTGNTMLRVLRRYGVWPRSWGPDDELALEEDVMRLLGYYLKHKPQLDLPIPNMPKIDRRKLLSLVRGAGSRKLKELARATHRKFKEEGIPLPREMRQRYSGRL